MPPSTSSRTRSVTPRPSGPAPGAPSSPGPPVIGSCHMCTAESTSWVVTCSSTATSVSGATTCSPVTTSVLLAMPALTMLSRSVRSLQACSWVSRSCGTSSPICHWPKTRMIVKSPSRQRTNSCWPWTLKATSPSESMSGWKPLVLEDVEDPPAQGVLVGRGREVGQGRRIAHGPNVTTAYAGGHAPPRRDLPPPLGVTLARRRGRLRLLRRARRRGRGRASSTRAHRRTTPSARVRLDGAHPRHVVRLRPRHRRRPALRPAGATARGVRPRACATTRTSCCSTPTPGRIEGDVTWRPEVFGHWVDDQLRGDPTCADDRDSAPYMPRVRRRGRRASTGATTRRPHVPLDRHGASTRRTCAT